MPIEAFPSVLVLAAAPFRVAGLSASHHDNDDDDDHLYPYHNIRDGTLK